MRILKELFKDLNQGSCAIVSQFTPQETYVVNALVLIFSFFTYCKYNRIWL